MSEILKKSRSVTNNIRFSTYMRATCRAARIGIGAALGVAMDNLPIGIGIGVAIGLLVGGIKARKRDHP